MSPDPRAPARAGEVPHAGVPPHLAQHMTIAEQQDWISAFLRRHPVSRRSALKGVGAALAGLAISTDPFARALSRAYAAEGVTVVGRRLSYGNDPRTQMRLAGELTGAPPAGKIIADVGLDRSYGATVPVEVRRMLSQIPSTGPVVTGAEQFFAHAALDNLRP
ncbi:MAG: phosphoesterase, partial [Frankiales bacterium]|nr:phosphoesterase [Frankiales bacterium]